MQNRMTQSEFCEKLEMARSYMCCVINRKVVPSKKLARAIEKFTKGQVLADELILDAQKHMRDVEVAKLELKKKGKKKSRLKSGGPQTKRVK